MATLCTETQVKHKAGNGASSTSSASTYITDFIEQAEGIINAMTRKDWVAIYGNLNSSVKGILEETCSNMAAIYVVQYDMSGYTSRIEAEDIINILRDSILKNISVLRDLKVQEFMENA